MEINMLKYKNRFLEKAKMEHLVNIAGGSKYQLQLMDILS